MNIEQINNNICEIKQAIICLKSARNKFQNTNKRENYCDYNNLTIAIECMEKELKRLKIYDWN